jgi:hypothetical protein
MLQYAAMNTDPLYQSSVERFVESATFATETIVKNRKIQKFTRAQGYFEYYNIPRPSCSGTGNVLLAISSRHMAAGELRRRVEKNKKALQILCGAIDQVGIKKFPEFFLGTSVCHKITIHARPLQLLQTLAQKNMKLADAAEEMSISISTANKQIAAAKVALNANTTASAVYRAIRAGLIEIEEEEEE